MSSRARPKSNSEWFGTGVRSSFVVCSISYYIFLFSQMIYTFYLWNLGYICMFIYKKKILITFLWAIKKLYIFSMLKHRCLSSLRYNTKCNPDVNEKGFVRTKLDFLQSTLVSVGDRLYRCNVSFALSQTRFVFSSTQRFIYLFR